MKLSVETLANSQSISCMCGAKLINTATLVPDVTIILVCKECSSSCTADLQANGNDITVRYKPRICRLDPSQIYYDSSLNWEGRRAEVCRLINMCITAIRSTDRRYGAILSEARKYKVDIDKKCEAAVLTPKSLKSVKFRTPRHISDQRKAWHDSLRMLAVGMHGMQPEEVENLSWPDYVLLAKKMNMPIPEGM